MNGHSDPHKDTRRPSSKPAGTSNQNKPQHHLWSIPRPIRRVFDRFPLQLYEANNLPQRARRRQTKHTLYIFTSSNDPSRLNWSCNPTCLKWQIFLILRDVQFVVKPSNNHASPSGSLPFLMTAATATDGPTPLVASKIARWADPDAQHSNWTDVKLTAYSSLIEQYIRDAWLYYLYLEEDNFASVARPLYITSASSNPLVHMAIGKQLQLAAREELLKSQTIIEKTRIYQAAERAFESLSLLLGANKFFSSTEEPGLFDASVFAYIHLILDDSLGWKTKTLQTFVRHHPVLWEYRDRILSRCLNR